MTYRMGILWMLVSVAMIIPARAGEESAKEGCGSGKTIYMEKCSQCHGDAGDGKGVGADYFNPRPRDLTSGSFKIRISESGELPTDDDLKQVIRNGMPYTGMPAWPRFSEGEVSDLVCFVKTFASDFADTSIHAKLINVPKAPAFSEKSAQKGRTIYEENKCMDCHGRLGRGDGESGPTLKDDFGNPIRPADLTRRWTFRGGHRREDIYRTFMTGLNGTPMPSFLSSIKEEDRWPLVDYIHSLSKGDEPGYASMVTAVPAAVPLDPTKLRETLASAKPALFPVVGQVIEGKRDFFPAVNAVEVRAVYDTEMVAIMISWHDMSAQKLGTNRPGVPKGDTSATPQILSDAISLQISTKAPEGMAKPYFLFGDKKNTAEILFADLGSNMVQSYLGKGRGNITPVGEASKAAAIYEDGEWSVIFTHPRKFAAGQPLQGGAFIPIAFSVWDGLSGESGDSRGVTSWYTLYLKPSEKRSPIFPAAARAMSVLIAEVAIVFLVRRRFGSRSST